MEYFPDRWIMVRLTSDKGIHHRIFASWSGGYLTADSWKLNSGVTNIAETEDSYSFEGSSGSIYHCRKNSYGSTGYGAGVLDNLITRSLEHGVVIEPIPEETDFTSIVYV